MTIAECAPLELAGGLAEVLASPAWAEPGDRHSKPLLSATLEHLLCPTFGATDRAAVRGMPRGRFQPAPAFLARKLDVPPP